MLGGRQYKAGISRTLVQLRKFGPLLVDISMMIVGLAFVIYGAPLTDGRWAFMAIGAFIVAIPMVRINRDIHVKELDLTGKTLRLRIEKEACMGVGSCVKIAPKVFKLDEAELKSSFISYAPLVVIDEKGASNNTLFRAAQSCPYKAIILEDEATGEQVFP